MSCDNHQEEQESEDVADPNRRLFLTKVSLTLTGLIGVVIAPPLVAALAQPLIEPTVPKWRDVGAVADFEVAETVLVNFENSSTVAWAGKTGRTAAWLRRIAADEFEAFTLNCAHLGCPVRWEAKADLFLCPCHGGVYYKDGSVAGGPPPHALPKYPVKVSEGRVYVKAEPVPITTMKA